MAGEIKLADIKKTQDTLGKYVKRPPLTEKLLRKPPFRFLHDIVTTVVRETKFFGGLFTDDEMNSENVTDKESKIAFLQKVIDVVNIACGVSLSVRPSKVVAGYEPEKTNELLQVIGKAIQKKVDSSEAVKIVLSKSKGSSKEQTNDHKPQTKKEEAVKSKKAAAPLEKKQTKDKTGNDISKQPKATPRVEEKDKRPAIREDKKNLATTTKDKRPKKSNDKPVPATKETKTESKGHTSKEKKKTGDGVKPEEASSSKRGSLEGKEKNGKSIGSARVQSNANDNTRAEEVVTKGLNREAEVVEKVQKKLSLETNDAEVEEAFPSLEPPVSEREVPMDPTVNAVEPTAQVEDGDKPGSAKKPHPNSGSNKANEDVRATMNSGQRVAIATPVLRPSSVMSMASSRPRSSRPRAPRLRSALGGLIPADDVDSAKGKVERIEGATGDVDVDAKEFLVEEARPPSIRDAKQATGGGDELMMGEEGGEKQQGLLVAKILETKKELEAGIEEDPGPLKRVEIEYGEDEIKRRRRGAGEVETLQSLVQAIARAAHPLGSLLGMLQENVEALRSETSKWRTECDHLMKLLREEEKQMEVELEPLRSVLSEVEQSVVEEREAVSTAKVRLLKAEQRIQIMLDPKGSTVTHRIPTQVS